MVLLKELISDLGGGRTLTLGGLLLVLLFVVSSRYFDSIEARFSVVAARIDALEVRQHSDDVFHGSGRFSSDQGAELGRRIDRLERLLEKQ
jgi:hypothetical protein